MGFAEMTVSPNTPMPQGYKLLRKGYPFMTALCRRKTLAAGLTLYVVRAGSKTLGLRAPRQIVNEVHQEEHQTRVTRRTAVAARDKSTRSIFETALRKQFPNMPAANMEQVLQRTLKKHSGRVGRTSTLSMEDKVRLAVAAHARHMHTDYDKLVRGETSREDARKAVYGSVREVLASWEGRIEKKKRTPKQTTQRKTTQKETKNKSLVGEEDLRRQRPHTRATTKAMSGRSLKGSDGGDNALDEPILISSDSEDDSMDILIISSDEE